MRRHLESWMKVTLALGMLLVATGCSRTVTWEEEVPLNTGETIWVRRTVPWEFQSGMGNPFVWALRPRLSRQSIWFEYRRARYSYSGGADVRWVLISPDGVPVLLAESSSLGWDVRNNYYCSVPQYVQFVPDPQDGSRWTWPKNVDSWTFNMPANLMAKVPEPSEARRRYSAQDREERDASLRFQWPPAVRIDPRYTTSCLTDPSSSLNGKASK